MFTCAKIREGSTYLGSHLTANDYYCENEHVTGTWMGKGAELLSLSGNSIDKSDAAFESLRKNLLPDGSGRLTPRSPEKGVRFFDFQCSAQKSVSILAVTLDDKRLYGAHDRAAERAFAELERFAAFRSGMSRQPQLTGKLCAAAFRHDASRALDPQLHTHFVVANATWDPDRKRWLALETSEIFKAIRYAGKVYQNELALECRRLGYQVESVRNEKGRVEGFEIKGVDEEIRERFSKRRAEVEAGIERFRREKGRAPTASEIHVITRETRNMKLSEITTPEVRTRQRAQLAESELARLNAVKQRAIEGASSNQCATKAAWWALLHARDHIFERLSVVRGHQVVAEALNRQLGYLSLETLKRYMKSASNGIVRLAEHVRNPLLSCQWASTRGLHLERWAIDFVNQSMNSCTPLGETEGVDFDFKSDEQREVVLATLCTTDRIYGIRGCAGAGKTTSLREIQKGLEAAGRAAFYLAPTASAVEVLRRDGFSRATTVDDFLSNKQNDPDLQGAVIIIDESSLQSTQMGASILRAAQIRDARVLFVGDVRQHVSVEAGDFLRVLERHSKMSRSELKDIRRQQVESYNAAIRTMAGGDARSGMGQLDELGWVRGAQGGYIQQAAESYFAATADGNDHDRCIAISPTWDENHRFTEAIRTGLKQRKLLAKGTNITIFDPLDWTLEQKKDASNYRAGMLVTFSQRFGSVRRGQTLEVEAVDGDFLRLKGLTRSVDVGRHAKKLIVSLPKTLELSPGDRILVRRNNRDAGLINGQVLTVTDIQPDGTLQTREGKIVPGDFRFFDHGYVVTSYKSQGRTHDHVVVAAEKLDSKAAYVSCSRGRYEARIFTPEKEHLLENLDRPADRLAVADVIGTSRSAFWKYEENIIQETTAREAVLYQARSQHQKSHEMELPN